MKKLAFIVLLLFLFGCAPSFTIPDRPVYRKIQVYQLEDGIALDREGAENLRHNVNILDKYAESLRKILEDMKR